MNESVSTLDTRVGMGEAAGAGTGNDRPKLLFMGPRSGGKSSIREVVFHKLEPDQTLHLESTRRATQDDINSFIDLEVWDLPGQLDPETFNMPLASVGAVIFVLDAQSTYYDVLPNLAFAIMRAHAINPSLHFEVFIHKIDSVAVDYRQESLNELKDRLTDELADLELQNYDASSPDAPPLNDIANRVQYRLTSVYDYSIFEALSRVIMKLIPQQAALENLMNLLAQQSGIEKCFLFDVWSKLYIATDSSPVDIPTLQLCSEFMDLFIDFSDLYGVPAQPSPVSRPGQPQPLHFLSQHPGRSQSRGAPGGSRHGSPARKVRGVSENPPLENGVYVPPKGKQRMVTSHVRLDTQNAPGAGGKVVSYYQVNSHLSLVCITHEDVMDKQGALIEYNVAHLRESISKILDLGARRRRRGSSGVGASG